MANETTTTTLNDLTHTSLIEPVMIAALSESPGIANFICRQFNMLGLKSNALSIPTETSWWGTAGQSAEAGVDTEFDQTEGTAIGNTAMSTGAVTLTCAEYGVAAAQTDNVAEDSVIDFYNHTMKRMLHVLTLAMDADLMVLFASLSNVVGTTNTDLSVANMISAHQGVRQRGAVTDSAVYVLDHYQAANLETALSSASTSVATYALSSDRLIGYAPTADHGLNSPLRHAMNFRGLPVFVSGLGTTANATVDVVGALVCASSAVSDSSGATTLGCGWKRMPRFEAQRQAKQRATDLVMSARFGVTELQDGSGAAIITNAAA